MQKIMFNERYGLTEAVLQGRKTMTRRIESGMENLVEGNFCFLKRKQEIELYGEKGTIIETIKPRYKVGEVVAVAQSYKDAGLSPNHIIGHIDNGGNMYGFLMAGDVPGWSNKMFVKAELMPNFIQFTANKIERLQDISDEDCLKEGVFQWGDPFHEDRVEDFGFVGATKHYDTPREAFAALIDKVSGRGTWDSNPWVFAYSYELVK